MMRSLALTLMVKPLLREGFSVFGDPASTHPDLIYNAKNPATSRIIAVRIGIS